MSFQHFIIKKRKQEEIARVSSKRLRLEEMADQLMNEAEKLADDAEKKQDLGLLRKSNALRKKAKEQQESVKEFDTTLCALRNDLMQM